MHVFLSILQYFKLLNTSWSLNTATENKTRCIMLVLVTQCMKIIHFFASTHGKKLTFFCAFYNLSLQ